MNINDVMEKYQMSIDDVLNVRAIYGGTVTIAPDEHLRDVTVWNAPIRLGRILHDATFISNR